MYSRDGLFLRSLKCYFCAYFPRCFAIREMNTKITLTWAPKQFVTRVHTLFSMYFIEWKCVSFLSTTSVATGVNDNTSVLVQIIDCISRGDKLFHTLIMVTGTDRYLRHSTLTSCYHIESTCSLLRTKFHASKLCAEMKPYINTIYNCFWQNTV